MKRFGFSSTAMVSGRSKIVPGWTTEIQRLNISGVCTVDHLRQMLQTGNCVEGK